MNRLNQDLDGLFQAYRGAVTIPEPRSNFMPELWERIDARRSFTLRLKRITQIFVGAAGVFCLLFAGILVMPDSVSWHSDATYLDVLAEAQPTENLAAQGILRHDRPGDPR